MTPEEWHKTKEVLQEVLELDPSARSGYLDRVFANQEANRTEIEALVRAYEEDGTFLEQPVDVPAVDLVRDTSFCSWEGRRLGPYQIIQKIGEGGMGTVFRAMRVDGLYDKHVAVKVIRYGLGTSFFIERFKSESRILARLEHPNIARLLDGGITDEGLPYVVLEFVAGLPIDEYCDQYNLPTDDQLELFRIVCSAVQCAHQNLVVHRDLKPGNILVTEEGVPKLLDFGIAKIVDPQHEESGADRTLTILQMMTPDFASPEQVRGDAITTASDVYSLGVVLYLLLTGKRPYRIKSSAPQEMIRAICDTEPEKPSSAARSLGDRSAGTERLALKPGVSDAEATPKKDRLRRVLSKDLDHIVLQALRKEPTRRYSTVEQFSEDIRRHLDHLPVSARKDTLGYRTSKFVTRHSAGVATAVVVAGILLVGMVVILREARIAQRRFDDVRQLANSLIFDVHDSIKDLPGSTPARKIILDRALQYLDRLAQEARGDLSLQRELATAYERVGLVQGYYLQNSLGDTQGSLVSYQKALSIRKQIVAASSGWNDRLALAQSYRSVANQQWALGDYPQATENITSAVAACEALNTAHPNNRGILQELGFDYGVAGKIQASGYAGGGGDPTKVEENIRKAVAADEELLAINPDDLDVQHAYATDLSRLGGFLASKDVHAALETYDKELQIESKLHQLSSETRYARGVAISYSRIGQMYDRLGDFPRSLENYKRGLKVSIELVRVDPKNAHFQQGLAIAYSNTASANAADGRTGGSLGYIATSEKVMRALVASSPQNVQQRDTLAALLATNGGTLMHLGRPKIALKELDEARSIWDSMRGSGAMEPGSPSTACTEKMGEAAARAGNSKRAAEYFNQVLKVVEPVLQTNKVDPDVAYVAADSYSGLGDLELRKANHSRKNSAKEKEGWTQARTWFLKSMYMWRLIEHPHHSAPNGFDAGDPAQVTKNLQLCDIALKKIGTAPRR